MHSDWKPSPHLKSIARQAGLLVPDTEEFNAALGEFIAYWMTQNRNRSQHEWDHALVKSLKSDRIRGAATPAKSPRKKATSEDFDSRNYGTGGRL